MTTHKIGVKQVVNQLKSIFCGLGYNSMIQRLESFVRKLRYNSMLATLVLVEKMVDKDDTQFQDRICRLRAMLKEASIFFLIAPDNDLLSKEIRLAKDRFDEQFQDYKSIYPR